MASTIQRQLAALLALGALLAGCVHATTSVPTQGDGAVAATTPSTRGDIAVAGQAVDAGKAKEPVCVVVTGSRLPSCSDPGSQALPTYSPLRVYSQDELRSTGRDGDLGGALQALDPAVTHR